MSEDSKNTYSEIFLAKSGKIFGPFNQGEVDGLYDQGKLSDYTWIWEPSARSWRPIDPPPAPIQLNAKGTPLQTDQGWERYEVFCLKGPSILKGRLECVTESGCLFISDQICDGPQFSIQGSVDLKLLDAHRAKGIATRALVANVEFKDQCWIYRLRWSSIPRIEKREDV